MGQSHSLSHHNSNRGDRDGVGGHGEQLGQPWSTRLHWLWLLSQQELRTHFPQMHPCPFNPFSKLSWNNLPKTRCFPIVLKITHKNNKQEGIFHWPSSTALSHTILCDPAFWLPCRPPAWHVVSHCLEPPSPPLTLCLLICSLSFRS